MERRHVHHRAARAVEQDRLVLHQRQLARADQVPRVPGQLDVQADHVGAAQQFVQLDETQAQALRPRVRRIEGPGDHLHADGACQTRHLGADGAGADHAQDLSLKHHVVPAGPAPGLELGGLEGRALGDREHQREHVLGHGRRRAPGLVGHDDAQFPRHLEVHHVGADGAGGDHPELGQGAQLGLAPGHDGARVDDDLGVPDPVDLFRAALRPGVMDGDLTVRREPLEAGGAGDLHRIVAGHDDLDTLGRWHFAVRSLFIGQTPRGGRRTQALTARWLATMPPASAWRETRVNPVCLSSSVISASE